MVPAGLLPAKYDWCIAGGWAACPSLANDIDVWVMVAQGDVDRVRDLLVDRYRSELDDPFGDVKSFTEEDDTDQAIKENDYLYHVPINTRRVGKLVAREYAQPYHIIVTDGGVREILGAFDVSTHQIAIMSDGRVIKGPGWTSVAEEPYKLMENVHTEARMQKIRARYKHYSQEV